MDYVYIGSGSPRVQVSNNRGGNFGGTNLVGQTEFVFPALVAYQFSVGGSVTGLAGTVTLQNNGGDALPVSANGPFTFPTALNNGAAYNVTVLTQPASQVCTVTNGTGTVAGADVTNVAVACSACGQGLAYTTNQWLMVGLPCQPSSNTVTGAFGNSPTANFVAGAYDAPTTGWAMYQRTVRRPRRNTPN